MKKIRILQNLQQKGFSSASYYYKAIERIDALKTNYHDYMTTAPINCDCELVRLSDADYDLTCALMTMLSREDYFCNGSFNRRYRAGQVESILQRMIDLLSAEGR